MTEIAVPVRVVLGEDNYLLREGTRELLDDDPSIEVVATAEDFDSTAAFVESASPDVLVTDIRMPPTHTDEGLRLAARLRTTHPHVGVVVLSQHDDPEYAIELLDDGAAGRAYLLKQRLSDIGQLSRAIHEVARGGSVIDPAVVDVLMAARSSASRSSVDSLSPREQLVLGYVAQGKSNAGIAAAIGATERSVERHVSSIFVKLNLADEPTDHRRVKAAILFLSRSHR